MDTSRTISFESIRPLSGLIFTCMQAVQGTALGFASFSLCGALAEKMYAFFAIELLFAAGVACGFFATMKAKGERTGLFSPDLKYFQETESLVPTESRIVQVDSRWTPQTIRQWLNICFWTEAVQIIYLTLVFCISVIGSRIRIMPDVVLILGWIRPTGGLKIIWPHTVFWLIRTMLCYVIMQGCNKVIISINWILYHQHQVSTASKGEGSQEQTD